MNTITITGKDAILISNHIHHMVEVFDTKGRPPVWRSARSMREANQLVIDEPALVRLKLDDRILLEHLTGHGLDHTDYNVREIIATHREGHPVHIMAIIERALGRA
jgi:hypothetical protein